MTRNTTEGLLARAQRWLNYQDPITHPALVKDLVKEIERLHRWRKDAELVLNQWDRVHQALPPTAKVLGRIKSEEVYLFIEQNKEPQ